MHGFFVLLNIQDENIDLKCLINKWAIHRTLLFVFKKYIVSFQVVAVKQNVESLSF